jgi:hypothetical protein
MVKTLEDIEKIADYIKLPDIYYLFAKPKMEISEAIIKAKNEKGYSFRKMVALLEEKYKDDELVKQPHFNTLLHLAKGNTNYTIENLLIILDLLDLKLTVEKK